LIAHQAITARLGLWILAHVLLVLIKHLMVRLKRTLVRVALSASIVKKVQLYQLIVKMVSSVLLEAPK